MTIILIVSHLFAASCGAWIGFRYSRIQPELKDKAKRVTEVIKE